jgi:MoaA/NifB/PqqE/SkfB family radical SAM enzyme
MIKEITVEIGTECPLNCLHCSTRLSPLYKSVNNWHPDILVETANKVIKDDPMSEYNIRFSGGEPMKFLQQKHFDMLELPNVRDLIITTSGYLGIEDFDLDYFNEHIIYRFSLYGNKKQHDMMTNTPGSYIRLLSSLEEAQSLGLRTELTTPITSMSMLLNVADVAYNHNKIPIRVARLVKYRNANDVASIEHQLLLAKELQSIYHNVDITCSLLNPTGCNPLKSCSDRKITVLATGKIIGCAVEKRGAVQKL